MLYPIAVTGGVPSRKDHEPLRLPISTSRVLVAFAIVIATVAFSAPPAFAYNCYYDPWADGESWEDNRWWADGCYDKRGEMLRAVQLIVNETYTGQGCWAGTPDGKWGPTTRSGVICYQAWKGLTADGIVGGGTWGRRTHSPYTGLMSELNLFYVTSDWARYELDLSGAYNLRFGHKLSGEWIDKWYVIHHCSGLLTWYPMDVYEPYTPSCW